MESPSIFEYLQDHSPLLFQLARTAEQAFVPDPNSTLIKVRQLGEAIAQDIASRLGVDFDGDTSQNDLLRKIKYEVELSREILDAFHVIRKEGNQDPNDEPASELLERIKQEREEAAKLAKAAKKTVKRKTKSKV